LIYNKCLSVRYFNINSLIEVEIVELDVHLVGNELMADVDVLPVEENVDPFDEEKIRKVGTKVDVMFTVPYDDDESYCGEVETVLPHFVRVKFVNSFSSLWRRIPSISVLGRLCLG
jgi:hypothetical protein